MTRYTVDSGQVGIPGPFCDVNIVSPRVSLTEC